jgi:Fe-S cluster assembly iron-binding protein IscA
MLCSSETVTDQAMQRQEALVQQQNGKGKGCQVPIDGLGFSGLEDLQVHHYTKSDSYSILQNHIIFL